MKKYSHNNSIQYSVYCLIIGIAMGLASCSSKTDLPVEEQEESLNFVEGNYELSKTQFESSDMKLGKLEMTTFHEVVKATGMFDVPPEYKASVSSYFGGTVKDIRLLPGEQVNKGQLLFILENPDFVQMQQDYLEAKGELAYLKSDYERQKNLAMDSISSQKKFLKADADYTVTKVKVESIAKKLTLMNINPNSLTLENIRTTISIKSPINGYITHVDITKGTFLNPSQSAISIVNTEHLHLELNIFEKDIPKVSIGQPIRFKIQEDMSNTYEASVHLVNKTVDPTNRTIGIHGHLSDDQMASKFSPGMYIEAEIYSKSLSKASLPENTLVDIEGKYFVLILKEASNNGYSLAQKEVQVGETNNGYTEILNYTDFSDNTQFLIQGAFNLITEGS